TRDSAWSRACRNRGRMIQRVAIAGFGAIGKVVAQHLDRGIDGLTLAAVSARDAARAEAAISGFARPVPVLPLARLGEEADIVVECAPAAVLRELAEPALAHGRMVMVLSCGALLDHFDLVDLARRHGGRILVPSGALLGLDAVAAAAQSRISSVHMVTRKPPQGLAGAPYLEANAIDVIGLSEPKRVFAGTAREAARGYRARSHDDRDLGRPDRDAQCPSDRGRGRSGSLLDADRERAVR